VVFEQLFGVKQIFISDKNKDAGRELFSMFPNDALVVWEFQFEKFMPNNLTQPGEWWKQTSFLNL